MFKHRLPYFSSQIWLLLLLFFSVPALARRVTIGLDSKNPSADEILRDISFEDDPVGGLIPNQMRVGIFLKHIFKRKNRYFY